MPRHRLPLNAYVDAGATWLVTIGVHAREARPLQQLEAADAVQAALLLRAEQLQMDLFAWCLMPDHAHLVLSSGTRSLVDVVGDLKSHTTRARWSCGHRGRLWQTSFHDHGLRDPVDIQAAITYVLENPVRAGLVEAWEDYPWSGGKGVLKS